MEKDKITQLSEDLVAGLGKIYDVKLQKERRTSKEIAQLISELDID